MEPRIAFQRGFKVRELEMNNLISWIFVLISLLLQSVQSNAKELHIIHASIVTRHGQRTVQQQYYLPNTSYMQCDTYLPGVQLEVVDELGGPPPPVDASGRDLPGGRCRCGQLTQAGYHSSLGLGSRLRSRYVEELHLLPPHYTPGSIFLRTTAVERTLHTLQGIVNGLYPDVGSSVQTVKVLSRLASQEYMYGKASYCPSLGAILERLQHDLDAIDGQEDELSLQDMVIESLGLNQRDFSPMDHENTKHKAIRAEELQLGLPFSWIRLYDTLKCMRDANIPLPPGASPELLDLISTKALFEETVLTTPEPVSGLVTRDESDRVVVMSIGPLIKKLLGDLHAGQVPPLSVYSGHDSTLMPLLHALNKPVDEWPDFASAVSIELWTAVEEHDLSPQDQLVLVYYSGSSLSPIFNGTLSSFTELVSPFQASDIEREALCKAV